MTRRQAVRTSTVRTLPPSQDPIVRFTGPYRFLSNFYHAPMRVIIAIGESSLSTRVDTVEHAYQAYKAPSLAVASQIAQAISPAAARAMGRKIAARPGWEAERIATMRQLLAWKFQDYGSSVLLADALVATGTRELVEGNTWGDQFWGMTREDRPDNSLGYPCLRADAETWWIGENWLGRLLMERRSVLQKERGAR